MRKYEKKLIVLIATLLLTIALMPASLSAQARYTVIDLGTLGTTSSATGLNDSGQVVGSSGGHGFIWQNGVMTNLGSLELGGSTNARAVNNSGQVVGESSVSGGEAFHAFLWQSGGISDLGTLGGQNSAAKAINDTGQIVGLASTADNLTRAVLWQGGIHNLVPEKGGSALGINHQGQIVGYLQDSSGTQHGFLRSNGATIELGVYATDVNDSGQVVGQSATGHAFVWQNNIMRDLGAGLPKAINDRGEIVGDGPLGGASIFRDTTWINLNTLIDTSQHWVLAEALDINNKGEIVGSGTHNGQTRAFLLTPRWPVPVLVVPGVGATYSADVNSDLTWLIHRGVPPAQLQIDPMTRVYNDLIKTLENVGYVKGTDLFIVNYDWRLPPGPDDGTIDGKIDGITAASISDQNYLYAVDYLGEILKQASEQWAINHPGYTLDAVDVITHSTGGLVARTYIQSAAYGGEYTSGKNLPKIKNLIMIGVPNQGASKAWNPLHDNWVVDPAFQIVLSKIINRAYQKVLNSGLVISGSDYNINLASITAPQCLDLSEICFINQYVPTARALLATYDFIDFGSGFTNVNGDPGLRNSLLLDLNSGDPNAFADLVKAKPTIIFGTNGDPTPTTVVQKVGPTSTAPGFHPIAEFANFIGRDAGSGETYYSDNKVASGGDGTVPLISSRGQFIGDSRVTLMPFTKGGNTTGPVDHTALPYNTDVQQAILGILGVSCPAPCSKISTGLNSVGANAATACAAGCSNFGLDPVEGFIVDAQSRRLGFSTATGPVTEIPGSVWFGNADGMGWVFGPVEEPLKLELTGLGESYYTSVSVLTQTGRSELIDQGVLAAGDSRVLPIPSTLTGVDDQGSLLKPKEYSLTQNYPNPFNPTTTIHFALPVTSHVKLRVFNLLGQEVATLIDGIHNAGHESIEWDAAKLSSGVYFYRIEATSTSDPSKRFTDVKKMVLIR